MLKYNDKNNIIMIKGSKFMIYRHFIWSRNECLRQIKVKVELPCWDSRSWLSFFIQECHAKLNYSKQVNITPQELILVVRSASKLSYWSRNNSRKFSILHKNNSKIWCSFDFTGKQFSIYWPTDNQLQFSKYTHLAH